MAISDGEWEGIKRMIEKVATELAGNRNFFTTGRVIKRDEQNMLVWMEEFGDQPIPIVAFDYDVKYYDETPDGTTAVAAGGASPFNVETRTVKAKIVVPKIGDTVLVASELGSKRLPRCLGVLKGKNWIVPESE